MNIDSFVYLDLIANLLKLLPGITEKTCFGTPAFYVNNKLFVRLKEDGQTLAIHTLEREIWLKVNPSIFFITEHYRNYSYMLIDLATVNSNDLKALLHQAWRNRAPAKLLKAYDALN